MRMLGGFAPLYTPTSERPSDHLSWDAGHDSSSPTRNFPDCLITAASALVVMHNHPSGESTPSEADIKGTRDLIRAGQLLKIELLDHVIVGNGNRSSLRKLGYFYS